MNTQLSVYQLLLMTVLPGMVACSLARAQADPDGTIIVKATDTDHVKLTGDAKIARAFGKPGEVLGAGMKDEQTATVGTWSKQTQGPSKVEFSATLPKDGYYDVYVRWQAQTVRGKSANPVVLKVHFDGGERPFQMVSPAGYTWTYLGAYPLKAGGTTLFSADAEGRFGLIAIHSIKVVPIVDPAKALAPRAPNLPIMADSDDDFDKLRLQFARSLIVTADVKLDDPRLADFVAQADAETYLQWKTMQKQPGMVSLWADLPINQGKPIEKNEGGGWPLVRTFDRVADMARAYVGCNAQLGFADKMQGNPELLKDILFALEWLYQNRYNERSINKLGAEWIGMEISIPRAITTTLLLLRPHVTQELIDKQVKAITTINKGPDRFYGNFVSTGANRLLGAHAYALRSILTKDAKALGQVNKLIEDEYALNARSNPLVRSGGKVSADGYYADGSFIQHGTLPYIGIYGRALLERYGAIQSLLAGSPWAINDPRARIYYDWVYRGYAPLFFNGEIMYGSLGRSTGQSWHQNGTVSTEIMNALVPLVPAAPPEDRAKLSSILKTWLVAKQNAAFPQFSQLDFRKLTPESYAMLTSIRNDPSLGLIPPPMGTTVFYNTDYVVHHQPEWAMQLRMFSTRIITHEDINEGTNRFGWYQGEGALFLYDHDNSRYNDNFWATVDPYRLPGTTVDKRDREAAGSKNGELSTSPWAGGVSLDGFGLASMLLQEPGTTLTAKKSWFFIGDQVVCLGSDISSTDNQTVETIVDNTKLFGDATNVLTVNGNAQPATLGWEGTIPGVRWVHLAGNTPKSDVAWVFPEPSNLKAKREQRTGNWQASFKNDADGAEHTRVFSTIWFDHGANPSGARYAYVLLPGRSAAQAEAYAGDMPVKIIQQDSTIHAVAAPGQNLIAANFWAAGKAAGVTASAPCAVLVKADAGQISISVSDPTQLAKQVELSLGDNAARALEIDERIKVESTQPLRITVNLEKADGKPIVARFAR